MSQDALAAAISGVVNKGVDVYTGDGWIDREVKSITSGIDVLGGVFGMFAVIALFVACLVIANTFTIVIAQRTREMALLRCVGASRRRCSPRSSRRRASSDWLPQASAWSSGSPCPRSP